MSAQTEAERLIKDAFYDARNAGRTMDNAAATAAQTLVDKSLLATKGAEWPNDPYWWEEWSNALTNLIPDGDESLYSNPDGAQESIITDCFTVYRAQLDKLAALAREHWDWKAGATLAAKLREILDEVES